MKERLLGFIDALRQAGVVPSVSESLDAADAVSVAGVEREILRESLAAALVKDHADRPVFDEVFDRHFALPGRAAGMRRKPRPARAGEGAGGAGVGAGRAPLREGRRAGEERKAERAADALARRKALMSLPFRAMGPREVEEVRELLATLGRRFRARCARRLRGASRGRLDIRRTIRRALSRGGVPIELLWRRPRPGKSDLLALVDLSYSTATAAEFLLSLLAPARAFFRRVTLLGYVDAPVEISVEGGHVVPHAPLDLNARSDFGKVLRRLVEGYDPALGRNTLLLILGDARNNRRPPRADLLARLRAQVRAVVWLNPEPPERWNTGDSVIATYARHSDVLLGAYDLETLSAALAELARIGI